MGVVKETAFAENRCVDPSVFNVIIQNENRVDRPGSLRLVKSSAAHLPAHQLKTQFFKLMIKIADCGVRT